MYSSILQGVDQGSTPLLNQNVNSVETPLTSNPRLFDVHDFIDDLSKISADKNQKAKFYSNNINAYDIAHNCIREIIFKIQNQPAENYTDVWSPIMMRATLGNAVHEFIQNNGSVFTEKEVSLKLPSLRVSVRIDCLINNNVVVEIKSCTYNDYNKILRTRKPRDEDFYQAVFYKYLLENHLEEAKKQTGTRTKPPKLDKYKIDYIQLVYVAHDIISSDCKSISDCLASATEVKKMLNSKHNQFHYITPINLNLNVIDVKPYEDYIVGKLNTINQYLSNNILPPMDNPYISKSCYFCIYKKLCSQYR